MSHIAEYWTHYLVVHFALAACGLGIELLNMRYLRVKTFCWALLFGPFFLAYAVSDLDRVVIDLRPRDKR